MKNNNPDEAIILCGGKGTRLQTMVRDVPKPLAQVSGRPFLEYIMEQLSDWGIKHALLSTGHLANKIKAHFGNHYQGIDITYVHEGSPLGTGGAMALASTFLYNNTDRKPVIVMNGDSYCQVDFASASLSHTDSRLPITFVLSEVPDVNRYGAVELKINGSINTFEEKGKRTGPGLINAGIYFIKPSLLKTIPLGQKLSFEHDVLPDWIDNGINGFVSNGTFIDIGTPESFSHAQSLFSDKEDND